MGLEEISKYAVHAFEISGIGVIVIGSAIATVAFLARAPRPSYTAYKTYRQHLGQAILLGLELLVAADIINTVGVDPTLRTVAVLGGVVLIRTFLSFSLEVEIEGRWPWRRSPRVDEAR
jgi:uncharacterized membrane protein